MPDPRTDEELVRDVDLGPPGAAAAFEALYRRHRDWSLRVAGRLTRTHADAADVVQDAFITLLGRFPGFVLRGRLTSFLYPVMRNRAMALGRRRRAAPLDSVAEPKASDSTTHHDELPLLRAAVDDLPQGQREVLLMRVVDGMDVSDVALALGIPEGTVKSRLHAAVTALRNDPRAAQWIGAEEK